MRAWALAHRAGNCHYVRGPTHTKSNGRRQNAFPARAGSPGGTPPGRMPLQSIAANHCPNALKVAGANAKPGKKPPESVFGAFSRAFQTSMP